LGELHNLLSIINSRIQLKEGLANTQRANVHVAQVFSYTVIMKLRPPCAVILNERLSIFWYDP
jgi:hypothetical protein